MPSSYRSRRKSSRRRGGNFGPAGILLVIILIAGGLLLYDALASGRLGNPPSSAITPTTGALTFPTTAVPASGAATPLPTPSSAEGGDSFIRVFFSDPLTGRGRGPDDELEAAINQAQRTVDVAIYNISLENIAGALIAAQSRGVQVRMVMESESMDKNVPTTLAEAGIPIIGDRREGLMHNKFTIIDGQEVWTGSMNYASTSAYTDFNNLVQIRSAEAAQNYTVEFEEMFLDDLFGPDTRARTPYPDVVVGGVPVEVYFSPDDSVSDHIEAEIRDSRQSIDVLAYSFTSDPIAEAILDKHAEGVAVRAVFDQSQVKSNTGGEYENLRRAGLDVKMDGINGLMHHKVIIIDGKTVITGSYNFSASAERSNDENLIIIRSETLAQEFLLEFNKVWQQ